MNYILTRWAWRAEPDAPRGWPAGERRLVVCEPGGADKIPRAATKRLVEQGTFFVIPDTWEPGNVAFEGVIPALYARAQADLDERACEACGGEGRQYSPCRRMSRGCQPCRGSGTISGVRALLAVQAERRAIVCAPREALSLPEEALAYFEVTGPAGTVRAPCVDLLVVAGEVGPDARPMRPDHVRSLVAQGRAAGVPVVFAGWGEWVPRSQGAISEAARKACEQREGNDGERYHRVGASRSDALLDGAKVRDPLPWLGGEG